MPQGLFGGQARGIFALPGNILRGYSAGYADLPQRYADGAEMRRADLEQRQAALAGQRRIEDLTTQLGAGDAAGELAMRQSPAYQAQLQAALRGPVTTSPGQTVSANGQVLYSQPGVGMTNRGVPWTIDNQTGQAAFGAPAPVTAQEQAEMDLTNAQAENVGAQTVDIPLNRQFSYRQQSEAERSNRAQEGVAGMNATTNRINANRVGASGSGAGSGAGGAQPPWMMYSPAGGR